MMIAYRDLKIGDIVKIETRETADSLGIVSKPFSESGPGHVLVMEGGYIQGMPVNIEDVIPADSTSKGFAQLAYNLIKLGSLVIEQGLL